MAIEFVTKIILFMMFIFVIENGFGLGFGGQEHSVTFSKHHGSSFRNIMDQAIYDKNLRNVMRCDL